MKNKYPKTSKKSNQLTFSTAELEVIASALVMSRYYAEVVVDEEQLLAKVRQQIQRDAEAGGAK